MDTVLCERFVAVVQKQKRRVSYLLLITWLLFFPRCTSSPILFMWAVDRIFQVVRCHTDLSHGGAGSAGWHLFHSTGWSSSWRQNETAWLHALMIFIPSWDHSVFTWGASCAGTVGMCFINPTVSLYRSGNAFFIPSNIGMPGGITAMFTVLFLPDLFFRKNCPVT